MATETKFTPGPWVIDPDTRPAEVCTIHGMPKDERTNYQGWAYVRGELGHWDASPDEEMANAHLIAAAPELFEALVELDEAYCRAGPGLTREERREDRERLIKARAALAKASGEA